MRFSESEIEALVLVAGSDRSLHPADLSRALNLRPETISRVVTRLVNRGLLERRGKEIVMAKTPAADSFKRFYFAHRASPLPRLLADRRVILLSRLDSEERGHNCPFAHQENRDC